MCLLNGAQQLEPAGWQQLRAMPFVHWTCPAPHTVVGEQAPSTEAMQAMASYQVVKAAIQFQ